MDRRAFLGGSLGALAGPVVVGAQQADRIRRVGLLIPFAVRVPVEGERADRSNVNTWIGAT